MDVSSNAVVVTTGLMALVWVLVDPARGNVIDGDDFRNEDAADVIEVVIVVILNKNLIEANNVGTSEVEIDFLTKAKDIVL